MDNPAFEAEMTELIQKAINCALCNRWSEAIDLNGQILKKDKKNVGALNRLGFAYLQLGKISEAKQTFEKVLTIDKYNLIAQRNLNKLDSNQTKTKSAAVSNHLISPLLFLEDPGKTKLIQCVNAAPQHILAQAYCGQEVLLKTKNHCIEIRDLENTYLGALPDDISFRLLKLISARNEYIVHIKNVEKNLISVFIREIKRGKKYCDQPSFGVSIQSAMSASSVVASTDMPQSPERDEELE